MVMAKVRGSGRRPTQKVAKSPSSESLAFDQFEMVGSSLFWHHNYYKLTHQSPQADRTEPITIPYDSLLAADLSPLRSPLSDAFGSSGEALGLLVVNELPREFPELRERCLRGLWRTDFQNSPHPPKCHGPRTQQS
jgi:hypothetical protein